MAIAWGAEAHAEGHRGAQYLPAISGIPKLRPEREDNGRQKQSGEAGEEQVVACSRELKEHRQRDRESDGIAQLRSGLDR